MNGMNGILLSVSPLVEERKKLEIEQRMRSMVETVLEMIQKNDSAV